MAGTAEKVMVVDDQAIIVRNAVTLLGEMDIDALGFTCPHEALDCLEASPNDFGLLMVDQRMPKMSGTELIQKAKAIQPTLKVIICTGFAPGDSMADAILYKPYVAAELYNIVQKLLVGTAGA